jgi:hypothetical protein
MSWRGMSAAHCPVCHVTLGDDILFDAHRSAGRRTAPSSLGLVAQGGVWGQVGRGADRDVLGTAPYQDHQT